MTGRHLSDDTSAHVKTTERPNRVVRWQEVSAGVISGLVVAALTVGVQWHLDDDREAASDGRENLRFVREQVAAGTIGTVPLRGIYLRDQNLSELGLEGAQMTGADLSGANMTEADFPGVQLRGADLSGATLRGARLSETQLQGADLTGADLTGAVFASMDAGSNQLVDADLSSTVLADTTLAGTTLPTSVLQADFSGADFTDTDLTRVTFFGVRLYGADLRQAKMPRTMDWHVCYNRLTQWPEGFARPSNSPYSSCVGPPEGP